MLGTCPALGVAKESLSHSIVVNALEKTKHALAVAASARLGSVLSTADRSGDSPVLPGNKKLGVAILEEQPASWVNNFFAIGQDRRYPKWVISIDLPGKSEE